MLEYMILPFKRYADFRGRSRRMEYWSFVLLNIIVYIVLGLVVGALGGGLAGLGSVDPGNPWAAYSVFFSGAGLLFVLWWLATIIPMIAVGVRRFHDRDMSGWWYLGFIVAAMIPFVGFIAGIAFLVIMLLPGTPGPNRFGSDPKDPAQIEAFS